MHSTHNQQPTRVVLLRHGQSTYNALGLYQGSSNIPDLTTLGRHQAQETAHFLKNIKFDAIYSSPLKRARDTAQEVVQAIASNDPPQIQVVPHLKETKLPQWEGLPFGVVQEQFQEDYQCWKRRPHEFRMKIAPDTSNQPTDFFPALELYHRIERFWQEILPQHPGKNLLVVSHGGTNRALISTALGVSAAHYHSIEQSNCGVNILNFTDSSLKSAKIEVINHISHVGETIPPVSSNHGLRLLLVPSKTHYPPQVEHLAQLLKDIKIDFSISDRQETSLSISQRILQHHPNSVDLQVLQNNFLQIWQETINNHNWFQGTKLTTGLVITGDLQIQHFLAQVLGMKSEQLSRLNLHSGTLSAIYYPSLAYPPTIQGVNIFGYTAKVRVTS
jgi:probable phosphoglycerate mutase